MLSFGVLGGQGRVGGECEEITMRKLIVLVLVVAFGLAVFWRIRSIKGARAETQEGVESIQEREGFPVRTVEVSTGLFEVWRVVQGKVAGSLTAELRSTNSAKIASIKYQVGDLVPADKPIIKLDKNDPQEMARVKLLKLVYDEAVGDYKGYRRVHAAGGVAKDVVEKMKLNMESAKSNYEAAKSSVDVVSPIAGVITSMTARVGERPDKDTALAVVSSIDEVLVMAKVSDRDVEDLVVGQKVLIALGNGDTVAGDVDRVSLGADSRSGLFDLEMLVDNAEHRLKVGVYVTTNVRVVEIEDAAWVPATSLLRELDGSYYVWQVEGGKAVKSMVTIIAQNDEASALAGINRDLPVVSRGMQLLKEGARVLVLESEVDKPAPASKNDPLEDAPEDAPGDTAEARP